jgi:phage terminase Nu1 subunit (DNA packaging protein)
MAQTSPKILANLFGITERRIQQLVQEGMPKESRGKYDLLKCVRWYVRFLHSVIEKTSVPSGGAEYVSERDERIRSIRADADLKEIELAKQRGQLVSIRDVEKVMTDLVLTTKARIFGVAPRIAPDLVGETSRIMAHAKIEKGLVEALLPLSKYEVEGMFVEKRLHAGG